MRHATIREVKDLPKEFIYPQLHPAAVRLETLKLGEGIYALLSNSGLIANSGFITGSRTVMVIDSHINAVMARQIIDAVKRITDRPLLYLVNTNYHGDHTFGNSVFPAETTVIAHRSTSEEMRQFELEKKFLLPMVDNDASVFGGVTLRLADVVFDRRLRIDLGGRSVELCHFGPGHTAGDVVAFQPEARLAWTGNLISGMPIPAMFDFGAASYLKTLANLRAALDIRTIVPGHGGIADGKIISRYLNYASDLLNTVQEAIASGKDLDQLQAECPRCGEYLPPIDSPAAGLIPFLNGLHALNLQRTYEELMHNTASGRVHTA